MYKVNNNNSNNAKHIQQQPSPALLTRTTNNNNKNNQSTTAVTRSVITTTTTKMAPAPVIPVLIVSDSDDEEVEPPEKRSKDMDMRKTPEQGQSLTEYCKTRGISVHRLQRANRQYGPVPPTQQDNPGAKQGGRVYWDSFSPPPGFIYDVEDFPASQTQSQTDDQMSPAFLLSNSSDRPCRPKARRPQFNLTNIDTNLDDLLPVGDYALLQGERRSNTNNNNKNAIQDGAKSESARSSSPVAVAVLDLGQNEDIEMEEDDVLSDSLLCILSQEVEEEYQNTLSTGTGSQSLLGRRPGSGQGGADAGQDEEMPGVGNGGSGVTRVQITPNAPSPDSNSSNSRRLKMDCLASTPTSAGAGAGEATGATTRMAGAKEPVRRRLDLKLGTSVGFEDVSDDDDFDSLLSQMNLP